MQSNCCLTDDNKDLASFRKRTEDIGSKLEEIKNATKVCHYTPAIHYYLQRSSWSFVFDFVACLPLHVLSQNNYIIDAYTFTSPKDFFGGVQVAKCSENVTLSNASCCDLRDNSWLWQDFLKKHSSLHVTCRRKGDPLCKFHRVPAASFVWVLYHVPLNQISFFFFYSNMTGTTQGHWWWKKETVWSIWDAWRCQVW